MFGLFKEKDLTEKEFIIKLSNAGMDDNEISQSIEAFHSSKKGNKWLTLRCYCKLVIDRYVYLKENPNATVTVCGGPEKLRTE